MNELLKYRKNIVKWTVVLVLICIVAIVLLLAAAPDFSHSMMSVILMAVIMLQVILSTKLGMMGIKITDTYIKSEEEHKITADINSEHEQTDAEKKSAEIVDTTFNLDSLLKQVKRTDDWKEYGDSLLYAFSKQLDMAVGMVFRCADEEFSVVATFAYYNDEPPQNFKIGEGISGQVAKDKKAMFLNELPSKTLTIVSGLGQIEVDNLAIIPILKDDNVIGLIEIATFKPFEKGIMNKINEISNAIGSIAPL